MATTVNAAFTDFAKNIVNLDSELTKKARTSRDWLIGQLEKLPSKINDFPMLFDGMHIKFGSFARNTKINPLDDIDLILTFHASGATYSANLYGASYSLHVPEASTKLRKLCDINANLNSIRLVNKIVSALNNIEQYKSAECHRNQEAATLNLSSYDWSFDIVPAFYTDTGHYLIPNGSGGWKATDPRKDHEKATSINQKHNGSILQIIRKLKYWNRRAAMPTMPPYLFENIILNYYNSQENISDWIDVNLINFWDHLKTYIYIDVPDPKGFQGNLNILSDEDKNKISLKAESAFNIGYEAYKIETEKKDHEKSINKWRIIFGDDFPKYE